MSELDHQLEDCARALDAGADAATAAALFVARSGRSPDAQLDLERRLVLGSRVQALARSHPTVEALVGQAFFSEMAGSFAASASPASRDLAAYSPAFAEFVATYEAAEPVPYLGDVARLEWALHCADHIGLAAPVDASGLVGVAPDRWPDVRLKLVAHAALLRTAQSPWDIIRAHREGAVDGLVHRPRPERWIVVRRGLRGHPEPVDPAVFELLLASDRGLSIGEAIEAAVDAAPDFDASTWLARTFASGWVGAIELDDQLLSDRRLR